MQTISVADMKVKYQFWDEIQTGLFRNDLGQIEFSLYDNVCSVSDSNSVV
jgi:hypothetical protein